jgi:YD repeat-containing protein
MFIAKGTAGPEKYITAKSYDADGHLEYFGFASPGIGTSQPGWHIFRYEYNDSGLETRRLFAGGNTRFDKIWDNRTSYDYS